MTERTETPNATITRTGVSEIETRFKPGIRLDGAGIAEVIRERVRMSGGAPVGVLLIIPSDTELDMAMISTDHLKANEATDNILGFAVVAQGTIAEALLRLYKAYYPTPFDSAVFTDEDEARAWLRKCIAEGAGAKGEEAARK